MKKVAAAVVLIAVILLSHTVEAEDNTLLESSLCKVPRCDELSQRNHLYIMNAEELGLSEEQIKKLREIKSECDREFVIDREKMRVAKLDLGELLKSDEIDMKKVEEKSREVSDLLNKIILKRTKVIVQSMMVLTADQKKRAEELFGNQTPAGLQY